MNEFNAIHAPQAGTIKVPGASIYYEKRGQGPLLLVIPGGPQDAGVFAGLAEALADRYTVVAYDPRGNSRSLFDGEAVEQELDVHGDDAAALIEALGTGPAFVFGTSGGAQIGLDLAARYPHLVRKLVAHEPPAMMLLDDPSQDVAEAETLYGIYRSDGVEAAMGHFFGANGLEDESGPEDGPPGYEPSPEEAETFMRISANFDYWLAHGVRPLSFFRPDVSALKAGAPGITVAIGEESAGQPIERMALALAQKLGTPAASFPGDHMGFEPHAEAFAAALHKAFSA